MHTCRSTKESWGSNTRAELWRSLSQFRMRNCDEFPGISSVPSEEKKSTLIFIFLCSLAGRRIITLDDLPSMIPFFYLFISQSVLCTSFGWSFWFLFQRNFIKIHIYLFRSKKFLVLCFDSVSDIDSREESLFSFTSHSVPFYYSRRNSLLSNGFDNASCISIIQDEWTRSSRKIIIWGL